MSRLNILPAVMAALALGCSAEETHLFRDTRSTFMKVLDQAPNNGSLPCSELKTKLVNNGTDVWTGGYWNTKESEFDPAAPQGLPRDVVLSAEAQYYDHNKPRPKVSVRFDFVVDGTQFPTTGAGVVVTGEDDGTVLSKNTFSGKAPCTPDPKVTK